MFPITLCALLAFFFILSPVGESIRLVVYLTSVPCTPQKDTGIVSQSPPTAEAGISKAWALGRV